MMTSWTVMKMAFLLTLAAVANGARESLSLDQQVTLMIYHNKVRRDVDKQMNMQCMVNIDMRMADEARAIAETCNQTLPESSHGLAMVISAQRNPLKDYVETAKKTFEKFIYEENRCRADELKCRLFRQVFWYEAHAMGCGKATCGDHVHLVCAYTYKQNPDSIPFIIAPYGIRSKLCGSEKPYWDDYQKCCNKDEMYDSDESEEMFFLPSRTVEVPGRDADTVENMGNSTNSTDASNAAAMAPANETTTINMMEPTSNFVELIRFWDGVEKRNILSTTNINEGRPGIPATRVGVIGKIARAPNAECPQLMPIHWLYKGSGGTDIYTLHKERYMSQGYENKRIIGYAVPLENMCGANNPLLEFYKPNVGTLQIQRGKVSDEIIQTRKYGKYEQKGVSFWMWKA